MLLKIDYTYCISGIFDFVKVFQKEKEFKKITGVKIDDWDFDKSDSEIIEELLHRTKEDYILHYNEVNDNFLIFKIKKGDK